jgi:hypothetical protein
MMRSIRLPLLNAIIFVVGASDYEVPEIERDSRIWFTSTCVAVGCTPDSEGETRITIGPVGEVALPGMPAFDGELETPTKTVKVDIVSGDSVLEHRVAGVKTRIRIWTNHPVEPDEVVIGLD